MRKHCRSMLPNQTEDYVRFDLALLDGHDGKTSAKSVVIDRIAGFLNNQFDPPNWRDENFASTAALMGISKPLQTGCRCECTVGDRYTNGFSIHSRGSSQPRGAMCSSQ